MNTLFNGLVKASLACSLSVLLVACGGSERSNTAVSDTQSSSTPASPSLSDAGSSSSSTAVPDAQLTADALVKAESEALRVDPSTSLESLPAGSIASKQSYLSGAIATKAAVLGVPAYRFYNLALVRLDRLLPAYISSKLSQYLFVNTREGEHIVLNFGFDLVWKLHHHWMREAKCQGQLLPSEIHTVTDTIEFELFGKTFRHSHEHIVNEFGGCPPECLGSFGRALLLDHHLALPTLIATS